MKEWKEVRAEVGWSLSERRRAASGGVNGRKDHRHRDAVVDMKIYAACNTFMQPSPSFDHGRGYRERRKRSKHDQS